MHELALCESMLRIIRNEASSRSFQRVRLVTLELGAFCGVVPDAFEFCFRVLTRGTLADGAHLEIVWLPGEAWCMHCGETVTIKERYDSCPLCGGYELHASGGQELRIRDLEVE